MCLARRILSPWIYALLPGLIYLYGCSSPSNHFDKNPTDKDTDDLYARYFKISGDSELVTIAIGLSESNLSGEFFCVSADDPKVSINAKNESQVIRVPVSRVVCLSAVHVAYIEALGMLDAVVGIAGLELVLPEKHHHLVSQGKIKDIGFGDQIQTEQLLSLKPEIVLVTGNQSRQLEILRHQHITVLPILEYLETHPLGRAEWIKVFGLLFQKQNHAEHIFDSIVQRYHALTALTRNVDYRPTVLSGKQYGGLWNLPGGKSYFAQLIYDAGGKYLWSENSSTGSLTLDFESVYLNGVNADFWRILISTRKPYTLQDLLEEDSRYAAFKAVREQKVFYCNTSEKPYFQQTPIQPDVLLADYISILHPELIQGHQRVYYQWLK